MFASIVCYAHDSRQCMPSAHTLHKICKAPPPDKHDDIRVYVQGLVVSSVCFDSCGVRSKEGNCSGVDLRVPKAWHARERTSNTLARVNDSSFEEKGSLDDVHEVVVVRGSCWKGVAGAPSA